jgi:hypothetical protein
MSELQSNSINPLENEFKKYLTIVDEKNTFRWATIKSIPLDDVKEYGDLAVAGIEFGWFRVIKFNKEYPLLSIVPGLKRKGFKHDIYTMTSTGNGFDEPVEEDEAFVEEKESGFQAFLCVMNHMMEELINNALMADSMLETEVSELANNVRQLSPYLVSLIWTNGKNKFTCEAENEDHAREQAFNAYPGCNVYEIKGLGEE